MRRRATALVALTIGACGIDQTVLRKLEATSGPATDGATLTPDGATSDAPAVFPPNASDVYDVAMGQASSCALARGVGLCWGSNVQGGLGTGDTASYLVPTPIVGGRIFDVLAVGDLHACGLERESGRVFCWGSNARGQLGQNDKTTRLVPTEVPLPSSAATISAGYWHSCAILRSGELFCWGNNEEGQVGTTEFKFDLERVVPTRVDGTDWIAVAGGQGHTCGLRRAGASAALWCWGRNTGSELGLGAGQPGQIRVPSRVGALDDWKNIDCGQSGGCGVATDGSLRCWGYVSGENPDGSWTAAESPKVIGTDRDWVSVSVDIFATCGIATPNKLRCWGRNIEGQLGLGDIVDRASPTDVPGEWTAVSVGRFHACAVAADRSIRCTGANDTAQLGLNDYDRRKIFTPVSIPISVPE